MTYFMIRLMEGETYGCFVGRYVDDQAKYCVLYVEHDIDVSEMEESVDRYRAECLNMRHELPSNGREERTAYLIQNVVADRRRFPSLASFSCANGSIAAIHPLDGRRKAPLSFFRQLDKLNYWCAGN